ncbi:hypothetical protein AVDCRST_MAG81-1023 [uncultured Synechococcales cyanobacterium]|uniref:Uncharacterized protein n=1 Tax=uncultured Synechococcales cyanobacterium TaxID=1936017 RepID=A0A6J4UXV5_9CYAN|nr:hypothetical protein AVDCRST_MAG81-1023 [uncultured Synechococcales cyanobacterium]
MVKTTRTPSQAGLQNVVVENVTGYKDTFPQSWTSSTIKKARVKKSITTLAFPMQSKYPSLDDWGTCFGHAWDQGDG